MYEIAFFMKICFITLVALIKKNFEPYRNRCTFVTERSSLKEMSL